MADRTMRDPGCLDTGDGDTKDKEGYPGKVPVRTKGLHLLLELLNDHIADTGEKQDGAYPGEGAVLWRKNLEADDVADGQQGEVDKYQH